MRKKSEKKPNEPRDKVLPKRGRGRPARVTPTWIRGRADHNRWILNQVWDRLWPLLSKAQTEEEVIKAFQEGASPYDSWFVPALAALVLQVLGVERRAQQPVLDAVTDAVGNRDAGRRRCGLGPPGLG